MMEQMYEILLKDAKEHNRASVLYKHHIEYVNGIIKYYAKTDYEENEANDIVMDYIASMTDDYFVDLYNYLFPSGTYSIKYKGYFE